MLLLFSGQSVPVVSPWSSSCHAWVLMSHADQCSLSSTLVLMPEALRLPCLQAT